ncbi:MAG: ABC transporter permease, partial [Peptococcaceae bacterium]|nr:ABC transporter permease [Peptococcaceae bacterium]
MLWRKMLRDLWEQKGTFLSLCAIISLGISVYISMYMTLNSLNQSIESYYQDCHFGDVFAQVVSMPESQAVRLEELSGISQVTSRLIREVRVLFPDTKENVFIRLISFEVSDRDALNLPYVFSGAELGQADSGIYLNPDFANANNLAAGDSLPVLIEGRRQELPVVGVAQSPEYVYAVSEKSDIFPNPARFGVAMIPREQMNQLFSAAGEVNSLSFRLAAGVTYEEIEVVLKRDLDKYGLTELVSRKDQVSYFMLDAEVTQLNNMGSSIPF